MRRGWRQMQEIQRGRKESRRTSETSQGMWFGRVQKGSLWLCYAGHLAEKRKSGISCKRHRPVSGRTQVLKHLPGAGKSKRGGSKGNVVQKGWCVRIIDGRRSEKMTQSNTSSPRGSEVPLKSQRG